MIILKQAMQWMMLNQLKVNRLFLMQNVEHVSKMFFETNFITNDFYIEPQISLKDRAITFLNSIIHLANIHKENFLCQNKVLFTNYQLIVYFRTLYIICSVVLLKRNVGCRDSFLGKPWDLFVINYAFYTIYESFLLWSE